MVRDLPLIIAFLILAFYTYTSGLRAPAMIAFVKDVMIYIVVIAAIAVIPLHLGGYGAIFHAAQETFKAKGGSAGLTLKPAQMLPFATLAFGSALAAFMYPHTMTGVFSSSSADTVRKNAILLPIYTVLLGLIGLLGYMAIAAGIKLDKPTGVVPALSSRFSLPGLSDSVLPPSPSAHWYLRPSCQSAQLTFLPVTSGRPSSILASMRQANQPSPR